MSTMAPSPTVLVLLSALLLASCSAFSLQDESDAHMFSAAFDLMGRASSTSEVLSLNLTNLLILLALKALIFFFGLVSGGGGTGRSYESSGLSSILNQTDMTGGMCFLMYGMGDPEKLSCVRRTACEDPRRAMEYVTAARMWHKAHTYVSLVPFDNVYSHVVDAVEEAAQHSFHGGDCQQYQW